MNLQAGQRFKGPLPWRAIAPTGNGQAIRLLPESPKLDELRKNGILTQEEFEAQKKKLLESS